MAATAGVDSARTWLLTPSEGPGGDCLRRDSQWIDCGACMEKLADVVASGGGYLIGSIPVGLLLGRALRGLDVREHGSGNMGTTNVLRLIGPSAAALTFALDAGKGSAAVLLARRLGADRGGQAAAGLAAVVGHSWPVLARFRGGKGVATAYGALIFVSPQATAFAMVGGLSALAATRIVSVGSLSAAASACSGGQHERNADRASDATRVCRWATASIFARHTSNIRRLLGATRIPVSAEQHAVTRRPIGDLVAPRFYTFVYMRRRGRPGWPRWVIGGLAAAVVFAMSASDRPDRLREHGILDRPVADLPGPQPVRAPDMRYPAARLASRHATTHVDAADAVRPELRADAVRPELRADAVRPELRADAVRSELRADAVRPELRPTL